MKMSGEEMYKHLTNFFKKNLIPSIKKKFDLNIDVSVHDIDVNEYEESNTYDIFIDTEPIRIDVFITEYIKLKIDEFMEYINIGWGQYGVRMNRRSLDGPFLGVKNIKHRSRVKEHTIKKQESLPFKEKIDDNIRERTFSENTDEMDLKWHWDEQDRIVTPLHKTDWMLQFDNELPLNLIEGKEYFIPVGVYHRVIKGTGDLKIKVKLL